MPRASAAQAGRTRPSTARSRRRAGRRTAGAECRFPGPCPTHAAIIGPAARRCQTGRGGKRGAIHGPGVQFASATMNLPRGEFALKVRVINIGEGTLTWGMEWTPRPPRGWWPTRCLRVKPARLPHPGRRAGSFFCIRPLPRGPGRRPPSLGRGRSPTSSAIRRKSVTIFHPIGIPLILAGIRSPIGRPRRIRGNRQPNQ